MPPSPARPSTTTWAAPYAYLSAERINGLFAETGAEVPEWQPILLGGLFKRFGRSTRGAMGPQREEGMRECERRASAYGLPPIAWPDGWPGNYLFAMRVAIFAKEIGQTVSFSARRVPPGLRRRAATSPSPTTCCSQPRRRRCTRARSPGAVERDAIKQRLRDGDGSGR